MVKIKDINEQLNYIEELEEKIIDEKRKLLKFLGWEHTSDTPGYLWMYRKKIKDKILLVDSETALDIERHLI